MNHQDSFSPKKSLPNDDATSSKVTVAKETQQETRWRRILQMSQEDPSKGIDAATDMNAEVETEATRT